jgi:hypothetical protein
MLSAQESPVGVPRELLEAKKLELQQEQVRGLQVGNGSRLTRRRCPKLLQSNAVAKVRSRTT